MFVVLAESLRVAAADAGTPLPMRIGLSVAPIGCGLLLAVAGYLGWRERLRRNRFAGIRTATTMRSEEAFRLANRVAGLPVLIAGLVGLVTGVFTLAVVTPGAVVTTSTLGLVGMVLIAFAGGVLGHRAADARPAAPSGGCTSCVGCGSGGCALR